MKYAESFGIQYKNTDPFVAKTLVEGYGNRGYVVQNPPAMPLTEMEMDDIYDLPYMNDYHPMYRESGGIPAISEVKFSLTSNRGCFGGCSFCALTFHQGRIVQTRSHESIIKEAVNMTKIRILRDIYMMWEALRRISNTWHVRNRRNTEPVRRNNVFSLNRVKILWWITRIIWIFLPS